MRVISGKAKGRKLKMVGGSTTRPITDRVKENLFNILQDEVTGGRWLDLFAGTGQVGIDALSRGAAEVVFVDSAVQAIRVLRDNLRSTELTAGAVVRKGDAFSLLRSGAGGPFDLIYVAPPQYREMWLRALEIIDAQPAPLARDDGLVVAQIHPKEFREVAWRHLRLEDRRQYGTTMLCFYRVAHAGVADPVAEINNDGSL